MTFADITFADQIEEVADGEPIEAVVIGAFGWSGYAEERVSRPAPAERQELLTWEQAKPMLDYEHDDGYGAPECDAIWAWTATRVLIVGCYDGSTWVESLPRHPRKGIPTMVGGG